MGFTIAQLSLLVNARIENVGLQGPPKPGSPQSRTVLAAILIAGWGDIPIGIVG